MIPTPEAPPVIWSAKVFSLQEAAAILGLHRNTVSRLLNQGDIRGIRIGREWRISCADMEIWWRSNGGGRLFTAKKDEE